MPYPPTFWTRFTELTSALLNKLEIGVRDVTDLAETLESTTITSSRAVNTGAGLLGGGDLSADRTISPDFGTGTNQVARGTRGLPAGGTTGQVPKKNSGADYDAGWADPVTFGTTSTTVASGNRGMPAGGATGQVLAKGSATDYDAAWSTIAGGGGGGVVPDASSTVKGSTMLSVDPVSAASPIAIGVNDGRVLTQGENDAVAGTNGTPSNTNRLVTDSDPRNTNARTPTAHASSHAVGGSDPITRYHWPASHFYSGTLTVKTGVGRSKVMRTGTLTTIYADINTAPTGAAVILGIKKNGTQITTMTITAAANSASLTGQTFSVAAADYLTVDVTQIGSTVAGSDLTVSYEVAF